MRRFCITLLFALAVLQSACRTTGCTQPADQTLEIASFNLRYNTLSDSANAWPMRLDAVLAMLGSADLIGVQEALPSMLFDIDDGLEGFSRIGVGRNADGSGEHSSILYRISRFELLDSGTFWLSETPDVPGSQGWDAALPRIATWGRFRDRRTGGTFLHVNTHFDHRGEIARRESAHLLVGWVGEHDREEPVLLTGDFNTEENSETYRILTEDASLRDARLVSETPPSGVAATWNDFGRVIPLRRIDFVFVKGNVAVKRFATWDQTIGDVLGTDDPRLPSDHYPVSATVLLDGE